MRLGVIWEPTSAANYRAVYPMNEMARRGHHVVWPADPSGTADLRRLVDCDLVHVYRRCDQETRRVVTELVRGGTTITYDNDDDFTAVPKESPHYKKTGGLAGQRIFSVMVKLARLAHAFTTPSEALAERYRRAGVDRVEVIGNYLAPDSVRPRNRHDGFVVGWVAGVEHRVDAGRIGIADTLQRLVAKHPSLRVESIGVNLGLPARYTHERFVPFGQLPGRIGGFDIGIAPLIDIPWNRARSDIKLKEYAASGVAWLASPVGPYLGLGEEQGGRLVTDDRWFEAVDQLLSDRGDRRRLARNGRTWAKGQTMDAVGSRWERLFAGATATEPASR